MKATGIVRRIDDLGRVVIPKEIRRTLRIREGDPHYITLTVEEKFFSCITEVHWKASCCIATTSIHETDMKQIPRMDARNNEVIREQFGE